MALYTWRGERERKEGGRKMDLKRKEGVEGRRGERQMRKGRMAMRDGEEMKEGEEGWRENKHLL